MRKVSPRLSTSIKEHPSPHEVCRLTHHTSQDLIEIEAGTDVLASLNEGTDLFALPEKVVYQSCML